MNDTLHAIPGLELSLGGRRVTPAALGALVRVRVRRELGAPAQCELTWLDVSSDALETLALEGGMELHLAMRGHDAPLFRGDVTAIEHAYGPDARHVLRVRGYDRLHRLRKRRRLRAHVRVTAGDLARDLTSDLGLEVRSAWDGPRWEHLIQHRDSDLDLLVEVAARAGLHPLLEDRVLWLDGLTGRGEPVPLERGATLIEATLEVNGDTACRSVTAHAWDPLRVGHRAATARHPRVGRAVGAEAPPHRMHADPERSLLNAPAGTDAHAQALAQGDLDRRTAAEVSLRGLAAGNPALAPGRPVEVSGVHAPMAGRYVLTAVTHQVDAERGFVTEISSEPPPARVRPSRGLATVGVVTQVADPDGAGRVRVRLPTYGDVETDWMRVAAPGAGRGKGLVAVPDVDDEVLVLLPDEDPARGVVLGGLFDDRGPEDAGVVGDAVKRFSLATAGGHRIVLDEAAGVLRIDTGRGSRIEMGPDRMSVHAGTDLVVEAPGRRLLFRAAAVDFERAG
jgi:phage baseplate assembly protein V